MNATPFTLEITQRQRRCPGAPVLAAIVPTRGPGERIAQTFAFEGIGLLLIAPLYRVTTGSSLVDSMSLVLAVSLAAALWSAAFNTLFDRVEAHLSGRLASDRPHGLRVWHAVLREATQVPVTCPVIYALSTMDLGQALGADVGLAVVYAGYGYLFHLAFDALCPVRIAASCSSRSARRTRPFCAERKYEGIVDHQPGADRAQAPDLVRSQCLGHLRIGAFHDDRKVAVTPRLLPPIDLIPHWRQATRQRCIVETEKNVGQELPAAWSPPKCM